MKPATARMEVQYDLDMEKVTVRLERKTLEQIKRAAGPRGVSRFVKQAAEEKLEKVGYAALEEWLREQDRIFGPIPKHIQDRANRKFKQFFRIKDEPRARARQR